MQLGRHLVAKRINIPVVRARALVWSLPLLSVARQSHRSSSSNTQTAATLRRQHGSSGDALMSRRFCRALAARHVLPITHRDVVAQQGLDAMQRPAG